MSTLTAFPAPVRVVRVEPGLRVRWDRLATVAVIVMLLGFLLAGMNVKASAADTAPLAPSTVVVQPGDTLWVLAAQHAPSGIGVLEYTALVEQVNGVSAGFLVPGTLLQLPQSLPTGA